MVYTLIKTDAFGNILWERTFSGDSACSVQQTRDGGYIAAGYGRDSGAYLIKTDASGNLVWEKVLGNSNTIAYCVQQTKDGGYILTGRTWGAESDVYLAKLSPDVSGGPRTFYVDDDAPNDPGPGDPSVSDPLENGTEIHPFDTIQEAIDAATSGDNVLVAQGTYREKVIMKDGVDLQGAGAEVTIIDSYRSFAVVTGANNCRLDGFTITGYADDDIDGVYCKDVEDFVISNNIIKNNTWSGVYALRSSVTISNNLILDNVCAGVWCVQESPVPSTIVNNTILGNADEADVALWYSASAVAVNNIVGDIDHWGSTVILVRNNILYQDFGGTNISTDPIFADPN
ncbi:MAG: DUF1565 domain-containing protein [Planctomycetota bacterium]|nr:DUF1565 domain-containing protein [Planctomycetota bacterium]